MHSAGVRWRGRSCASVGGYPPRTEHLHADQQPENRQRPTSAEPLCRAPETVLLETVFLASGLLRRQRRWRYAGNRAALCGKSGDQGKTPKGQTARLTPSWPTAHEGECAGECSIDSILMVTIAYGQ